MFKRFCFALFLFCMNISSYAYVIESTLTLKNNTDIPMVFTLEGQSFKRSIPAHSTSTINKEMLNNNDYTGFLYRAAAQGFEIRGDNADNQLYVQGRIVYYISGSYWQKYSFLDSLSAAEGLTIDTGYTCEANTSVFNNSIIIDGKPGKVLQPVMDYSKDISCRGLKTSTLEQGPEFDKPIYKPTCRDGHTGSFDLSDMQINNGDELVIYYLLNPEESYGIFIHLMSSFFDMDVLKQTLDNALNVGNPANVFKECALEPYTGTSFSCNEFCASWSKQNALIIK